MGERGEGNPAGEAEWRWSGRQVREDISVVIPKSSLCLYDGVVDNGESTEGN